MKTSFYMKAKSYSIKVYFFYIEKSNIGKRNNVIIKKLAPLTIPNPLTCPDNHINRGELNFYFLIKLFF